MRRSSHSTVRPHWSGPGFASDADCGAAGTNRAMSLAGSSAALSVSASKNVCRPARVSVTPPPSQLRAQWPFQDMPRSSDGADSISSIRPPSGLTRSRSGARSVNGSSVGSVTTLGASSGRMRTRQVLVPRSGMRARRSSIVASSSVCSASRRAGSTIAHSSRRSASPTSAGALI